MRRQTNAVLASACVLAALACIGQCQAQSATATTATCTADPKLPAFEVAAVTPVAEKNRGMTEIGKYGLPSFTLRNVSLSFLLNFSFDVPSANFVDAPHGLDDAVFDVQVKSENGTPLTYEELKPRMQQLLQQRFCLKAHTGTKQVSGYALVPAKGGAKMTPLTTPGERGSASITLHEVNATSIEMGAFAAMLTSPAGRPVQDQTGLQGKYNLKVQFSSASDDESTQPSIFTAIKEQLGLELKPAQVPVQTLIIEHVNLTPTEN